MLAACTVALNPVSAHLVQRPQDWAKERFPSELTHTLRHARPCATAVRFMYIPSRGSTGESRLGPAEDFRAGA